MPLFAVCAMALLPAFLTGCVSAGKKMPSVEMKETSASGVGDALQSPLYDFNLKKVEIPEQLLEIQKVYGVAAEENCAEIRHEILRLSEALGPDVSDLEKEGNGSITLDPEDALGSAVSGLIPYNDVIRYLSGASKYEKKVATAFFRGHLRRAFLKGRMAEIGCTPIPRVNPITDHDVQQAKDQEEIERINRSLQEQD